MLFSTNSATALSGLACELAMMLIAFQWSAMRSLPPRAFLFVLVRAELATADLGCGVEGSAAGAIKQPARSFRMNKYVRRWWIVNRKQLQPDSDEIAKPVVGRLIAFETGRTRAKEPD
jgi:hypothetical protein